MPTITYKDKILKTKDGTELLHVKELPIKFGCTRGECGVCSIRVISGKEHLTKMCKKEEQTLKKKGLNNEHRLACQCALNGNIVID